LAVRITSIPRVVRSRLTHWFLVPAGPFVRAVEAGGIDEIADAGAGVDHLILGVGGVILDGARDAAALVAELEAELLADAAGGGGRIAERIVGVDERRVVGAREAVVGVQPRADGAVDAEVVALVGLVGLGPRRRGGQRGEIGRALETLVGAEADESVDAVVPPGGVVGGVNAGGAALPVVAVVVLAADAGEAREAGEAEGIVGANPTRVAGIVGHADVVLSAGGDAGGAPAAAAERVFDRAVLHGPPEAGHRRAAEVGGDGGVVDDVEIGVGEEVAEVGGTGVRPIDIVADQGLAAGEFAEEVVGENGGAARGPAAGGLLDVGEVPPLAQTLSGLPLRSGALRLAMPPLARSVGASL
jgi:hypothetical protein